MLRTRVISAALACALAVLSGGTLASCTDAPPATARYAALNHELSVGNLSIRYPDGMRESAEGDAVPYPDVLIGGSPAASAKAIVEDDAAIILSKAQAGTPTTLDDARAQFSGMEVIADETLDRQGFSATYKLRDSYAGGLPCVVVDAVFYPAIKTGDGNGNALHGIAYVIADKTGTVIGEVRGYFYDGAYEANPERYDSVLESVRLKDATGQ